MPCKSNKGACKYHVNQIKGPVNFHVNRIKEPVKTM